MEISVLYDIFQTRLEERGISVRTKVEGEIEILPHLCTIGQRSGPMLQQAMATANIRFLSMSALIKTKKRLNETLVGSMQDEHLAQKGEGDLRKYERAAQPASLGWPNASQVRPRSAEERPV